MWTLEASYMELLSVLNLMDLTETKLLFKKEGGAANLTGKQQPREPNVISCVVFMQGASLNGGHVLNRIIV